LVDTSVYCTSVIRHVLDVHMHEMLTDGFIDKVWNSHLRTLENYHVCAASVLDETQILDGEYALQITDVGGVFVFHAILIFISILVTIAESPWRRKRHDKRDARKDASLAEHARDDAEPSESSDAPSRPSLERLASARSLRNLAGAELANFYQVYQESSYMYDAEESIKESIRNHESIRVPPGDLLKSIEKMSTEIDRLHKYVVAKRKRNKKMADGQQAINNASGISVMFEDDYDGVQKTSKDEDILKDEPGPSSGGNPNEGK
jgi:hypothetical protein